MSEDHSGILILDAGAPLGADVASVLGLDQVILELEITPNRPDAMSLLGIAREVAAMDGLEVRMPEPHLKEGSHPAAEFAEVVVEDEASCPRYLARVIEGVTPGPSPGWVRRRLSAGVRPISNLVDATNYALLIAGHPMHAFDLDRLNGFRIVVRSARAGEALRTIDGVERRLDPVDLVIADASHAVALAGIMGGEETEVSETTRRVLLESAYFAPASVLRSSKRHGLRTEASARFERGADPNNVAYAAELACRYILDWAGGEVASGAIDRYPAPIKSRVISLRPQRANLLLGTDLEEQEMAVALSRLGLEVGSSPDAGTDPGERAFRVTVPTRRPDLSAEVDLIEEVARITGYDRIPSRLPPGSARAGGLTREQRLVRKVRQALAGAGLFEAHTSSLIGPADLDRMGYSQEHPARLTPGLTNPLSVDESLLRTTLLPGLAAAAARNVARRNLTVGLFEIGRCFLPTAELLPEERLRLGVALHGPVPKEWHSQEREMDFFDLKGALETLFEALGIADVTYRAAEA
ncbi:MAG: phenylalanine--tRNA ligase subunit beta, partial [Actinomycetota bacterium]